MNIAIIGKGRVASHLGRALSSAGHEVAMCGGRNRDLPVPDEAEVVILSVKDSAISQVAQTLVQSKALVLHTSGSVPMDSIPSLRRGVFYPLQTFSLDRNVDFRKIPIFLEAGTEEDMSVLSQLASTISDTYLPMDSERRKILHLAAVLCCNFVNHLFAISHDILAEQGIPFSTLFPLMEETLDKVRALPPHEAQTGPAVRWDENVIQSHISMLANPVHREIYRLLSESIHFSHTENSAATDNDKLRPQ